MVKHRRRGNTLQPIPPGGLENVMTKIGALFPDMELVVSRPNGTKLNAIVEVSVLAARNTLLSLEPGNQICCSLFFLRCR